MQGKIEFARILCRRGSGQLTEDAQTIARVDLPQGVENAQHGLPRGMAPGRAAADARNSHVEPRLIAP